MSVTTLRRQWIPFKGGSCDVRIGHGAIEEASKVLSSAVGKPRRALLVMADDLDAEVSLRIRRQVVDAGFVTFDCEIGGGSIRTLDTAATIAASLFERSITADDLCVVAGDADLISVVSHVLGTWCGGTSVAAFPTDEVALVEGALVPRGLDFAGQREMIAVAPAVKRVLLDCDLALSPIDSETACYVRALMVAAAMCGAERDFQTLWDRAPEIMGDDEGAYVNQLIACAKSRGQVVSSTAAAIRQSVAYGQAFGAAVDALSSVRLPASALLAEGMRFAARIAVGLEKLSIDDMLAQDELLEALGIGTVACAIEPEDLVRTLKEESFRRQNRFHVLVPLGLGRVRLTAVEDEMLLEHARAWCATHAPKGD